MTDHIKRRAALLARCSSEANVCDQILKLKQAAAGNYHVDPDDIYGDQVGGGSAFSERAELSRLRANIENGSKQYDVVLATDPSRIARTPEGVQELVEWLEQKGVQLRFVQD
ncbi:recombinase family protein [Flaviaesturariibacter flavus]|nr:recombinase family protein [Flaviaesturariibacter flavus]